MTSFRLPGLSFRTRILLVVLAVGIVPVAVIGFWLAGATARSGEALLRARLNNALQEDVRGVERSWVVIRSALLDLLDAPPVQQLLGGGAFSQPDRSEIEAIFDRMAIEVPGVVLLGPDGDPVLRLGQARAPEWSDPGGPTGTLRVNVPAYRRGSNQRIGALEAAVSLNSLRPGTAGTALSGGVISAMDPETGAVLHPTPFDPSLFGSPRFEWRGETWVVERAEAMEPPIVIVAAAPLGPFAEPFRDAATRGSMVLLLVAALGVGAATLFTRRITASLERVEKAASAVAEGDLQRTVPEEGSREVVRLAHSFNRMTDSLRSTLAKLTERESLSAVNEFAAALAHEVRNPLTSIKIDLQEVEESLPEDSRLRRIQGQALEDVLRLDRAVQGALETARSGTIHPRPGSLLDPLEDAVRAARPRAGERKIFIHGPSCENADQRYEVDPDALQRAFLNLILNAVEASPEGGDVHVAVSRMPDGGALVEIRDRGRGIPNEDMDRVFDAFFTTRAGGTGVGLPIARRIAVAHGGELCLKSIPGEGTVVEVRLPPGRFPRPA